MGPVKNGEVVYFVSLRGQVFHRLDYKTSLITFVQCLPDQNFLAMVILCPKFFGHLVLVVGYNVLGGGENILGGPVILFQKYHLGVGVVLLEVQDVLYVGIAESVNGLGIVAYRKYVPAFLRQ